MVIIIAGVVFSIAGFLLGFGDIGRGTYSSNITNIAGLIWLGGIVYLFVSLGWIYGLLSVPASFVTGMIFMPVGKFVVQGFRRT